MRSLIILAFACLLFPAILYSQNEKTVLGTFAVGCKVYNYDFRKATNGLYSFKIQDIDKEDNKIVFNKDTLSKARQDLSNLADSLDAFAAEIEEGNSLSTGKKDSLNFLIGKYDSLLTYLSQDSSSISFWKNNKDSITALTGQFENMGLDDYDIMYSEKTGSQLLVALNSTLKGITEKLAGITETKTYYLNDLEINSFTKLCNYAISQKKLFFMPECPDTSISSLSLSIFYQIKARLDFKDDEPVTAYLKLKSTKVDCFYRKRAVLNYQETGNYKIKNKFLLENIQVEFEDGTIKNILADFNVLDSFDNPLLMLPVRFKNTYPISISGKNDKDYFSRYLIYVSDIGAIRNKIDIQLGSDSSYTLSKSTGTNQNRNVNIDLNKVFFILSDLLSYEDVLENDKEDYSPVNCVVVLNKKNEVQLLRKEKRSRIVTLKAFTDFVGIRDDEPNGLIQFEASRKCNLLTRRNGVKGFYVGMFTYIEPKLLFSKLEKNNNSLGFLESDIDLPASISKGQKVFNSYALNLLRYQSSSFDVDVNYFKLNIPSIKSNLQANVSLGLLRTNVSDTLALSGNEIVKSELPNNNLVNTFRWGLSLIYEIKPDSRYGMAFGYDIRRYNLLSRNYNINLSNSNVVSSLWADAYLKTNDENKLFFRYKVSFVNPAEDETFVQVQLGYLVDLFGVKK